MTENHFFLIFDGFVTLLVEKLSPVTQSENFGEKIDL
jgi:hypothetical protein